MKKIRIGNDILLKLDLFRGFSDNRIPANIQSIKVYIINTTVLDEKTDAWKKSTRFIGRFPHEPFLDEYLPTQFNINCSGAYRYHTAVANRYVGFGCYPDWTKHVIHKESNDYIYTAPVIHTEDKNIIVATFPAVHQHHIGTFKVLAVVKCYESGYNSNNVRTYTVDYPEAFQLVATSAEADKDVSLNLDLTAGIEGDPNNDQQRTVDIYTYAGSYLAGDPNGVDGEQHDRFVMKMSNGGTFDVITDEISGWYEED